MPKYRKEPIEVDAVLWDGNKETLPEIKDFMGYYQYAKGNLIIYTCKGRVIVSPGDYIIKEAKGEYYSCKPEIFKETYEEVKPFDVHKTPLGAALDAGHIYV